jgi:hypothetical protein
MEHQRIGKSGRPVSTDGSPAQIRCIGQNRLRTGSVGRFERDRLAPRIAEIENLRMNQGKVVRPDFRQLEPTGQVVAVPGRAQVGRLS